MPDAILAPSLSLNTSECSDDDAARFVPLFQEVWNGLPDVVKKILLTHWRTRVGSPSIRLHSFGKNSAGNTRCTGHDLRFNCDLFRFMPDWCGTTAIAHELGHILFLATEETWHTEAEASPGSFVNVWSCELINLELTRRWGYKQDEFSEWINCDVSLNGPYLRATANEPPLDIAVYQANLASMTNRWAREQGLEGDGEADAACRSLLLFKEPYYRMATVDGQKYEAILSNGLQQLGSLLREESNRGQS